MTMPGVQTGTGSYFAPGVLLSTARTNPAAPSFLAVSETFLIDDVPATKLKE